MSATSKIFDGTEVLLYVDTAPGGATSPAWRLLERQRGLTFRESAEGVSLQIEVLLVYGEDTQTCLLNAYDKQEDISVMYIEPAKVTGKDEDTITAARVRPTAATRIFPDAGVAALRLEAAGRRIYQPLNELMRRCHG